MVQGTRIVFLLVLFMVSSGSLLDDGPIRLSETTSSHSGKSWGRSNEFKGTAEKRAAACSDAKQAAHRRGMEPVSECDCDLHVENRLPTTFSRSWYECFLTGRKNTDPSIRRLEFRGRDSEQAAACRSARQAAGRRGMEPVSECDCDLHVENRLPTTFSRSWYVCFVTGERGGKDSPSASAGASRGVSRAVLSSWDLTGSRIAVWVAVGGSE